MVAAAGEDMGRAHSGRSLSSSDQSRRPWPKRAALTLTEGDEVVAAAGEDIHNLPSLEHSSLSHPILLLNQRSSKSPYGTLLDKETMEHGTRRQYSAINDVVWNPTQGLHMMTAGKHSGLQLWYLRPSTSMPLATLDNTGGLSCDWCPLDDRLLLRCGTDNKTKLWDLYTLKVVAEIAQLDSVVAEH